MKIKIISKYFLIAIIGFSLNLAVSGLSYGQNASNKNIKELSFNAKAIDSTTLTSGKTKISLWGIEKIDEQATIFHLKIRKALENKIDNNMVLCVIKEQLSSGIIKAQCINSKEEDLSLFLLKQGYASADREAIYGSVYENPYLNAEERAQINKAGIWGQGENEAHNQGENFLMGAFSLVVILVLAIILISFYIMRGFSKVVDVQNKSIDLAAKERQLKDKEKYIIASMIDAEVRSNKVKIEAYLTIYEETLSKFNSSDQSLEYQKTGDIVQRQPALSRSVFDGNTNKLNLLGSRLASNIIHYYARIKTTNDYIEISPDMPIEEAKNIIQNIIESAKKLNDASDRLTESFIEHALIKRLE